MLKVTTTNQNQTITLKLEGKLAGPWVQEVTRVWADTAQSPRSGYVVDLRSVTFIDSPGQGAAGKDVTPGSAVDCGGLSDEKHRRRDQAGMSSATGSPGIYEIRVQRNSTSFAPTITLSDLYTCPTSIKDHIIHSNTPVTKAGVFRLSSVLTDSVTIC